MKPNIGTASFTSSQFVNARRKNWLEWRNRPKNTKSTGKNFIDDIHWKYQSQSSSARKCPFIRRGHLSMCPRRAASLFTLNSSRRFRPVAYAATSWTVASGVPRHYPWGEIECRGQNRDRVLELVARFSTWSDNKLKSLNQEDSKTRVHKPTPGAPSVLLSLLPNYVFFKCLSFHCGPLCYVPACYVPGFPASRPRLWSLLSSGSYE